jgi:hypothetical protein
VDSTADNMLEAAEEISQQITGNAITSGAKVHVTETKPLGGGGARRGSQAHKHKVKGQKVRHTMLTRRNRIGSRN